MIFSLQSVLQDFSECTSSTEKFEFLIELAKELPVFPEAYKIPENKILGCASSAWIVAKKNTDGTFSFFADADAQIAKGFLAMLVLGFEGATKEEILATSETFLKEYGITSSLSPSRANGALASFEALKKKVQESL